MQKGVAPQSDALLCHVLVALGKSLRLSEPQSPHRQMAARGIIEGP